MIAIVNYGLGNVQAIANIYQRLHLDCIIATRGEELNRASHLILPGVGSFDWAMRRLDESGLRSSLEKCVMERQKPVLGICVGLQMLARRSEEGVLPGLGWIDADVLRFDVSENPGRMQLPHMGWNEVSPISATGLFHDLGPTSRFYFLHSYYFKTNRQCDVLATTDYNGVFASSAGSGHVMGVQFHPEKSHKWGVQLLQNFSKV